MLTSAAAVGKSVRTNIADPRSYRFCVRRETPAEGFDDLPALYEWLAETGHRCQTSREVIEGRPYTNWHFENYVAAHSFMRTFGGEPWEDLT